MNAKEHAASEGYHLHKAKHHETMAQAHSRLAEHFFKSNDNEAASCHEQLASINRAVASVESERSDYHRQAGNLLATSEGQPYTRAAADDLNKLRIRPDNVRSVTIPYAPDALSPEMQKIIGTVGAEDEERPFTTTVVPVPRPGAPPMNTEKHAVPLELAHFVKNSLDDGGDE